MPQTVADVMTPYPVTVPAATPIAEVARAMRDADVGAVIVVEGGMVRGIVTDRDLAVRAVAEGRDPQSITAVEVCSPDLMVVHPDDDLDQALELMREGAVRRLPVVEGDRAVGILSLGDVAAGGDSRSTLASVSAAPPNR